MSIAIGIDVSTTKLAFGTLADTGHVHGRTDSIASAERGARRLRIARACAYDRMHAFSNEAVAVVVVEIPWAARASSFALLSIAAVVLEAAQVALPGAVVLDMPTPVWKQWSVGHGNASKEQVMEHASGLGYGGRDQDIADALCMAQAGMEKWRRASEGEAA